MNNSNITVYTSLNNDKDPKRTDNIPNFGDYNKFKDPRRNSRIAKILAHQYIKTEYSIYIDGNVTIKVLPETLIEKYLKDYDIAVYRHPTRDCVYDEALACCKMKLDDVETIIAQAKAYEDAGYARHKGLAECAIIFRRHTPEVENFNNIWWGEYCRHSRRDQISFMYAADKAGIRVLLIDDFFVADGEYTAIKQSGDFSIITHNHKI